MTEEEKPKCVQVKVGEKVFSLPVENDGNLSLIQLKEYFPRANGLVYESGNVIKCLRIESGKLVLESAVNEYLIHVAEHDLYRTVEDSAVTKMENEKRNLVMHYRKAIELQKIDDKKQSIAKIKIANVNRNKTSTSLKEAQIMKPKLRTVNIGWKHRYNESGEYIQRKRENGGGTYSLSLESDKKYSVKDVIEQGKKLFTSETAKSVFLTSDCELGFFQKGSKITSFSTPENEDAGLFQYIDYYKENDRTNSKTNLYLLTSTNPEYAVQAFGNGGASFNESDEPELYSPSELATAKVYAKIIKQTPELMHLIPKKVLENTVNVAVAVKRQKEAENQNNKKCKRDDYRTVSEQLQNKENEFKLTDTSTHLNSECRQQQGFNKQNIFSKVNNSKKPDDFKNVDTNIVTIDNTFNLVNVIYSVQRQSEYSGLSSRSESGKLTTLQVSNRDLEINLDNYQSYEPLEFGCEISSIEINLKSLYKVDVSDSGEKFYQFYSEEYCPEHTIMFDIDTVYGYSDGRFRIGVIPKCSDVCKPIYKWYCNDQLYKEDFMLYWLSNIPLNLVESTWQCKISCNAGCDLKTKKLKITNQCSSLKNDLCYAVRIDKDSFTIGEMIGGGAQSKVYKGSFNGKTVAIKVVDVMQSYMKNVEKEIKVLQSLTHKSFVKIIGYCKTLKKVYILMEYFDGKPLNEVIQEEDYLELTEEKKKDIIIQLCNAFCFLHHQLNPVIHRDIKLENLLINKEGLLKVLDFGLSTFQFVGIKLRTTISTKVVGTFVYFAPEIMLDNKLATPESGVWAIGCVILELYSEQPIWNDADEFMIQNALANKETPNMNGVPDYIQGVLKKCFSFEPLERPSMLELLNEMKSI